MAEKINPDDNELIADGEERNITRIERDIPSIYDGKRIYCVVADSVQHPLVWGGFGGNAVTQATDLPQRTEETRTIQQPAGRLIAQAAHVVSKVRHNLLKNEIVRATHNAKGKKVWYRSHILFFEPCTTIILSCRDSFELSHLRGLLGKAEIKYERFLDTNPDVYGAGLVSTAIATHPVAPNEVIGILDYLPLWKPRDVQFDAAKVL